MLENFKQWMIINRKFSNKTVENYIRTLSTFNQFLINNTLGQTTIEKPEKITLHLINSFIVVESVKGKTEVTTNNELAGIKCFIRYCMIEGYKTINPHAIIFARENQLKIESLETEEAVRLLNYFKNVPCETEQEELIKTRNLLICSFFLYTGLRVNELSHLKKDEVMQDFQIIGKGGKRRYVHLSTETWKIFQVYTMLRKDDSERLFVSHSNNNNAGKLSNVSIEKVIKKGGENAGLKERVFPHKLRHTFATELVKNNVKLLEVQKLLGHENIKTTQNYLTVRDHELKTAVETLRF